MVGLQKPLKYVINMNVTSLPLVIQTNTMIVVMVIMNEFDQILNFVSGQTSEHF